MSRATSGSYALIYGHAGGRVRHVDEAHAGTDLRLCDRLPHLVGDVE